VGASQADPVNVKPADDPCRTGGLGTGLSLALLAAATPAVEAPFDDCEVDRILRLRDLFPRRVIAEDDANPDGWFSRLLDALDPIEQAAFARVDCFPAIIDPLRCPAALLDQLLFHLGSPFTLEEGLTENEKRRLATVLHVLFSLKGTCPGIVGAIRILYGINVTECIEPNIDCWELDIDELDIDTYLCPGTAFERRSFSIMVDVNLTDRQRQQIRNIVNWMKPANTHFIEIIEPGHPNHNDHWILDFSLLGENTDLH